MLINQDWVEKYRPTTFSEYVFTSELSKAQLYGFVEAQDIPSIIFAGQPGTGKSTACKILINSLDMNPGDLMEINCANNTGVDFYRDTVIPFIKTTAWAELQPGTGRFRKKIVVLEEYSEATANAMHSLKVEFESNFDNARFLITTNNVDKVIDAIKSRCLTIQVNRLSVEQIRARCLDILEKESVEFTNEALEYYIETFKPDMRGILLNMNAAVIDKKLMTPYDDAENLFNGIEYDPIKVDAKYLRFLDQQSDSTIKLIWATNNKEAISAAKLVKKFRKEDLHETLIEAARIKSKKAIILLTTTQFFAKARGIHLIAY